MPITIRRFAFPPRLGVLLLFAASCNATHVVSAQSNDVPFTDPAAMFEEMFGESSAEERAALEKVEISIAEERKLGEEILLSSLASLKEAGITVEKSGRDVDYLQSLVDTLKPNMKNPQRYPSVAVLVARSPRVDARSIPGGTLVFYEGLLDKAGSEAALVGIVGHELSHLDHGHQLIPLKRQKLTSGPNPAFASSAKTGASVQLMTRLWARPFRPEDEREADRDGAAWALAAGYDPREMAKLFQSKSGEELNDEKTNWAAFFRSHPYDHERRRAILQQVTQMTKGKAKSEPLFIGRENLKLRVSRQQQLLNMKK